MTASTAGPVPVRPGSVVLDCPDPGALAAFYAALLGRDPADTIYDGTWARLVNPAGGMVIEFQPAPTSRSTPTRSATRSASVPADLRRQSFQVPIHTMYTPGV